MKNLQQTELSFWEKETWFRHLDFVIIGAGIVGCSTAIHLRKKYPDAKILILERAYLPMGASTKNAGFACFGSVTELMDDLSQNKESLVWETVAKRHQGLQYLRQLIGDDYLDFQQLGSWDLIDYETDAKPYREALAYLNEFAYKAIGEKDIYSEDQEAISRFGFNGIQTSFNNRLEGQIMTGKMMWRFQQLLTDYNILLLTGVEVMDIQDHSSGALIQTNIGEIPCPQAAICVNGFANRFLKDETVLPARAQVLITHPIENLRFEGTFHYQMGYYYFRNVGNRVLLGGGRNLDFTGETTESFEINQRIINDLKHKLEHIILQDTPYEIDSTWAGIMGVGEHKKPIVKRISAHLVTGVRMGGMGVAIGTLIGKETADLL